MSGTVLIAGAAIGRLTEVATIGRLSETVETLGFSIRRVRIGARLAELLELELALELELELLLELFRGIIQVEKFVRTFRKLDINIVVWPGMESCGDGLKG